jgi:hypothetical protein
MTHDEARFLLTARRPGGADDAAPPLREALEQAARDPALSAWVAKEQRFDGAVAAALRSVAPPPALRAQILAGAAAQPRSAVWWRKPVWLAMAAAATVGIGLAILGVVRFRPSGTPPADTLAHVDHHVLRAHALRDLTEGHETAVYAHDVGELGRWLENPAQRLTVGLPLDFEGLRRAGCRTLTIAGREVLEVCFTRGEMFHLYIARRSDFPAPENLRLPDVVARDGLASAVWTSGDLVYVLAAAGDQRTLRAVL